MARQLGRWLLSLGLLGCLTAHGLAAHAASPVWAIRGAHNTVYLAGSVHLLRAGDSALPAAFDRAYAGSRELVMELDVGSLDPTEAAGWMMAHGTLPQGVTLQQRIGATRYQRVASAAQRVGLPIEMLQQLQPWVIGLQLLDMQYLQLGFAPAEGVEQQLDERAQADGKPVIALESLAEQLGVLGSLSEDDQSRFLDMIVTEMGDVGSDTQQVIAAWRAGDAQHLADLLGQEYRSFPALYRTLVTERNRRWLPQIQKLLQQEQDCLVIVGALHLVGEDGLLQLMRREGYQPRQLD